MDPGISDERGNGEESEQLSMEELMKTSMQTLKEGEVVHGTVVAVTAEEVLVDIGFKSEGIVPIQEFTDDETGKVLVEVNDQIEVFIERMDEMEGQLRLSRDRAAKLKTWRSIEEAYRGGTPVVGKVLERVKGGLAVDIGIRAFLPGSLVDLRPNRRLEDYIDTEVEARVIAFDRRRSNVVLSRKAVLEDEQGKVKAATMSELEEGKLVAGVVKNITDYGVFVDLGGLDGLLHITDISWGRVGHPSEYFEVGDEVEVVILRFDRDKERVSLGYKQRFEDPWVLVPERYPVGKRVTGKVVSIVDYGCFVALEDGVEGLIHVSEMSWTKKIKNPRSVLEVGQEVEVVVSEVSPDKRRLSLSLRAIEPNPWEQVAESYQVGSRVKGVVRNLTDFGGFVEIIPGVDGLVHISDMSWTRRINHPSEVIQKGQEVEAIITSVDVLNQRISLSMKELLPNEWEEYANSHGVGDVVGGSITNITDFGIFVELSPGVEGLCHISEIDRESSLSLAEMFSAGQTVACRILRIDWNENRIGLSMHGVSQEDVAEVVDEAGGEGIGAADTAMAVALKAGGVVEEQEATTEAEEEAAPDAEEVAASEADEAATATGEKDEAASKVDEAAEESVEVAAGTEEAAEAAEEETLPEKEESAVEAEEDAPPEPDEAAEEGVEAAAGTEEPAEEAETEEAAPDAEEAAASEADEAATEASEEEEAAPDAEDVAASEADEAATDAGAEDEAAGSEETSDHEDDQESAADDASGPPEVSVTDDNGAAGDQDSTPSPEAASASGEEVEPAADSSEEDTDKES
jgi:small subunit ribosomal protein S1